MRERVSTLAQADAHAADVPPPAPADGPAVAPRGSRRGSGPVTRWERHYRYAVVLSDTVAVTGLAALAGLLGLTGVVDGLHPALAPVIAAAVLGSLLVRRAWAVQVLGDGAEEYRRLGAAVFSAAVVVALIGPWFERLDVRPWLLVVLPAIALAALVARYVLRQWLHRSRRAGRRMLPVVVAGAAESVRDLIERTREHSHVGWRVEAACIVNTDSPAGEIAGVPVIGSLDQLADHVRRGGYRVVAITPAPQWTPEVLRSLAWDLEGTSAELAVAPVLMEVAGPRVNVSGVLGMPMLRVSQPAFTGGRRLVKAVVDRIGALLALLLTSPVLVLAAVAIKLGDGGPVFYKQLRVKRDGEVFAMWKLRTMHVGADRMRAELPSDADGPLFKLRRDPRVTRVGAVLRRFSLDELPQLVNVLTGSMSLVGPRPPLLEETQSYGPDIGRRLLVKPGMTGLWQVSGRSDLSWEDSVRLDLRYVEDWSLALDAAILWKTIRAVLSGRGAY
jgi:exopolysaccharide biosynthesis polyprenyl glycosylphosphotransferase